jgi:hypothetical protein
MGVVAIAASEWSSLIGSALSNNAGMINVFIVHHHFKPAPRPLQNQGTKFDGSNHP